MVIYIYVRVCICMCVRVYIYIYIVYRTVRNGGLAHGGGGQQQNLS